MQMPWHRRAALAGKTIGAAAFARPPPTPGIPRAATPPSPFSRPLPRGRPGGGGPPGLWRPRPPAGPVLVGASEAFGEPGFDGRRRHENLRDLRLIEASTIRSGKPHLQVPPPPLN